MKVVAWQLSIIIYNNSDVFEVVRRYLNIWTNWFYPIIRGMQVKKFEIIEESIHPFSFVFQFVTRTIENLIR